MQHGLARMAVRVEAGALEHLGDFVADIGDLPRRADIGARGEQADDAQLALEPAVGRIEFDADIIHADAAMRLLTLALTTMRTVGSRINSRISGVMTTISVPRRKTFTSGSRRIPRPSPC
jgi:hypothetical protein